MCKICEEKPVYITENNKKLCKNCFVKFFEKKVFRTIRLYNLIDDNDKVAVAISGGKDSLTCLSILDRLMKRRGKEVTAIAIDEGIAGYRDKTLSDAEKFCKENAIKLHTLSFKEEIGKTLDQILKTKKINPCTACGIFRRYLMNKGARMVAATKLATGHNLDDEAQSILMNQFKGNVEFSAKLGPLTGVLMHQKFVRRIKPLYFMTEKEVTIYAFLKKLPVTYNECPYFTNTFRGRVQKMLNDLEAEYPGTKHSIVNSFMETLPKLRELYQKQGIGTCIVCNEPSARKICRACELMDSIRAA